MASLKLTSSRLQKSLSGNELKEIVLFFNNKKSSALLHASVREGTVYRRINRQFKLRVTIQELRKLAYQLVPGSILKKQQAKSTYCSPCQLARGR